MAIVFFLLYRDREWCLYYEEKRRKAADFDDAYTHNKWCVVLIRCSRLKNVARPTFHLNIVPAAKLQITGETPVRLPQPLYFATI